MAELFTSQWFGVVVLVIAILVWLVAVYFTSRLINDFRRSLEKGEKVSLESNWGGFGNNLGGWTLSRPLSYLLAILIVALVVVLLTGLLLNAVPVSGQQDETASPTVVPLPTVAPQETVGAEAAEEDAATAMPEG